MTDEIQSETDKPIPRLVSIDALRGFDMFWIVGAEAIVHALDSTGGEGFTHWLSTQFKHVSWEGFRFYDFIFPLFIFIVGISITLSLDKVIERDGKKAACLRIVRRSVLLYVLGFLFTDGFSRPLPDLGLFGVLQRIALCYLCASLLYVFLGRKALIGVCAAILVGYWVLLTFVPVPVEPELTAINPEWGAGGISTERGNNWAHYFDHHLYIHHVGDRHFYNEGLFSTLPAICTALLGIFAGWWIRRQDVTSQRKVLGLIGAGVLAVILGYLWGLHFPVIKKLWTSSYVMLAGGYSALLLALFMQIIDVWGYRKWAAPFVWIGANALVLYLASDFVEFDTIAQAIAGGDIAGALGDYGPLLVTVVQLGLIIALARFLYVKRIFIRL